MTTEQMNAGISECGCVFSYPFMKETEGGGIKGAEAGVFERI